MSTISSSLSAGSYGGYLPMPSIGVAQTGDSSLVQAATSLSEQAGVLSSIDGASSTSTDAVDLLNSFVQPYNANSLPVPTQGAANAESTAVQGSIDQQLLGGSTDPVLNAAYGTSSQSLASSTPATPAAWASIVKNSPAAVYAMTNDAVDQSIVSQLSTYA